MFVLARRLYQQLQLKRVAVGGSKRCSLIILKLNMIKLRNIILINNFYI